MLMITTACSSTISLHSYFQEVQKSYKQLIVLAIFMVNSGVSRPENVINTVAVIVRSCTMSVDALGFPPSGFLSP
jgi:hypothetical protein